MDPLETRRQLVDRACRRVALYDQHGDPQWLELALGDAEVVEAHPEIPVEPDLRLARGLAHAELFRLSSGPAAAWHLDAALADLPVVVPDLIEPEDRARFAYDTAVLFYTRFDGTDRPADLKQALAHLALVLGIPEARALHADATEMTAELRATRGQRLFARFESRGRIEDLDAAVAELTAAREALTPAGGPMDDRLAATLRLAEAVGRRVEHRGTPHDVLLLASCLEEIVDRLPEDDPDRPGLLFDLVRALHRQTSGLMTWLPELDPLLARLRTLDDADERLSLLIGVLYVTRFISGLMAGRGSDFRDAAEAVAWLEPLMTTSALEPEEIRRAKALLGMTLKMGTMARLGWDPHNVLHAQPGEFIARLAQEPDSIRADRYLLESGGVDPDVTAVLTMMGGGSAASTADIRLEGDLEPLQPMIETQQAAQAAETAVAAGDVAALGEIVVRVRRLVGGLVGGDVSRPFAEALLGWVLTERGRLTRSRDDVQEALVHLRRSMAATPVEIPTNARSVTVAERLLTALRGRSAKPPPDDLDRRLALVDVSDPSLRSAEEIAAVAEQHRRRGDDRRAAEVGERALRELTFAVLLVEDAAERLRLARRGNQITELVVRRYLGAGDTRAAIDALETGRGLVLHATTFTLGIAAILRRSGQEELARAWEGPGHGRARALRSVAHSPAGLMAISPIPLWRMQAALWASELDVLVYLLPGDGGNPGHAILVPEAGEPRVVPLPRLRLTPGGPVAAARSAPDRVAWRKALTALSAWAHDVAMGPVLAALESSYRRPRIGLIPIGELSTVPWHAAARPEGGGVRYVVQDAVISYAPSARQLADAVSRPTLPVLSRPAILANPTGDLHWAEVAGLAARDAFYPGGDIVRTRAEVLDRLPSATADGASLLQLSTHAMAEKTSIASYFVLADGEHLSVGQILDHARGRRPDAPGGLVICDSCLTDVTQDDHDEVLTLGTAFLAAGAVAVIGAKWPLDDHVAAVMSFMLHRHLAAGVRPVDALNRTQLWMLDPARPVPPELPPDLTAAARNPNLARISAWAGLIHQGK